MSLVRVALLATPLVSIGAAVFMVGAVGPVLLHAAVGTGILVACGSVGASVLRPLDLDDAGPLERALMAVAAGGLALGLGLLALGWLGWLRPAATLATVTALAGAAALHTRPWRGATALGSEIAAVFAGRVGLTLLLAGAVMFGLVLAAAVMPPWDWDTLMYHLPIPEQLLETGTVFLEPASAHLGYIGTVHMLYAVAAALGTPNAAVVVSGLFGLLLVLLVLVVARLETGPTAAGAAAAGVAGTTIFAFVALTPRVDVTVAFYLFLAHYAVLRVDRGASPGYLLAAAVFGAGAAAAKVHAVAYLLPLGAWAVWLALRRPALRRTGLLAVVLLAAVVAPWQLRNFLLFDDSLLSLMSGAWLPSWAAADPAIARSAGSVATDVLSRIREPVTPGRLILDPGSLVPEQEGAYYVWSPLLLVGALFVMLTPASWRWAVPALVYGAAVLGWSRYTNLRYLIPVVPALSVAAAAALWRSLDRWPGARRAIMGVVFAGSLAPIAVPAALVWTWVRSPIESGRYDTIYAAASVTTRVVPPDGVVLMLYEARGYPFERTVIQDNRLLNWPLLAASGHAETCMRGLPFTHVLLNTGALGLYQERIGDMQFVSDGGLERFVRRCLEPVAERGAHVLFRVRDPSPLGPS